MKTCDCTHEDLLKPFLEGFVAALRKRAEKSNWSHGELERAVHQARCDTLDDVANAIEAALEKLGSFEMHVMIRWGTKRPTRRLAELIPYEKDECKMLKVMLKSDLGEHYDKEFAYINMTRKVDGFVGDIEYAEGEPDPADDEMFEEPELLLNQLRKRFGHLEKGLPYNHPGDNDDGGIDHAEVEAAARDKKKRRSRKGASRSM